MTADVALASSVSRNRPSTLRDWRSRLDRDQVAPVVAIAGSRGKTSVLRIVESIFSAEGQRTATWTNRGVEIERQGQRGELGPWSRAMTRLRAGGLDVAFREFDWTTIRTLGLPESPYPLIAVTNLCANSEACLATFEMHLARKALHRLSSAVSEGGKLILNANDFDISEITAAECVSRFLVGASADVPTLRRHLDHGGDACWLDDGELVALVDHQRLTITKLSDVPWTREGLIPFAIQNALFACAIALSAGMPVKAIAKGLAAHEPRPESMPGSFNLFPVGAATVVIDRPMPSWFLRTCLRGTTNLGHGRQVRIVGPMLQVPDNDLSEVGRLLGRQNGVIVLHGSWQEDRLSAFRQGVAANEVPPVFVIAADERRAIQQGLDMLRAEDVMLILAENAPAAVRLVSSRVRRLTIPDFSAIGVA